MNSINFGIVGAGGIGSYYAGVLSHAGNSVTLLTRGDHLCAIRQHGLEVQTPEATFIAQPLAMDDSTALNGVDYLLVAVKSFSLAAVSPLLKAAAASGTTIVPLLNGVDVANRLEAQGVPRASLLVGLVATSVARVAPGRVERTLPERVIFGELDRVLRGRTMNLVDAFIRAGVAAEATTDIDLALWRKFAFIVPVNVVCGLMRGPIGLALASDSGRDLLRRALAEIAALSHACGTSLSPEDIVRIEAEFFGLPPMVRPSFLADLERGGPTELDLLTGCVSRLGKEHNVSTPIHDLATAVFEATIAR
ncbi:MAG: ketopantoate reductase family protein [Steroidobacteraceae bacterium]